MKTNNYSLSKYIMKISCFLLFFSAASLAAQNNITAAVPEEFKDGIDFEIIKSIAEKLDSDLTVKEAPFARRLRFMETGKADITAGLLKTPEREEFIYFITPPYKQKSNKLFFVTKGNKKKIRKYEDLYSLTVGINTKSRYFSRFDNDTKIKKEATSTFRQNILKLLAGRIDTVIYTDGKAFLKLQEIGLEDVVEPAEYHFSKNNPVYIGISKQSELIYRSGEIEETVSKMIDSGEIDSIIQNYFTSRNLCIPEYK